MPPFEPIKIVGIIEQEVSEPRNDGTRGATLYNVPFKLSQRAPIEWADYFPKAFDHPKSWTSAHRPGICHVSGDRIWLNGTTLEEVEQTHNGTLLLALEDTNTKYAEHIARTSAAAEEKSRASQAHKKHVTEAAAKIKFD